MSPVLESSAASAVGGFTASVFAETHSAASVPAWWSERKRAAYDRFAALPLPRRGDESWRFSNVGGLRLDGFRLTEPPAGWIPPAASPFGPAALAFCNNRLVATGNSADWAAQRIVVTTLTDALKHHPELLRAHFMAQPQKLGSEKFAALHAALVQDGAFIHVPRGVEVARPIIVAHHASGEGTAVFPHTLVVAEDGAKVTVVDYFVSDDGGAQFACGANDLYAGHGASLSYIAAQSWSRRALSFQLNSTVVRRDARAQSLNLHLGGRQARHESLSQLQAPGAFSEMLALTVASGEQEFDQRTLQVHQAADTKSDLLYKNALLDASRTIFSGLI